MNIAILTNYPLFDNAGWKVELAKMLLERGFNVSVYYGKSGVKQQFTAACKKIKNNKVAVSAATKRSGRKLLANISSFHEMGISVYKFQDLNDVSVARYLKQKDIDCCVCALDQILKADVVKNYPRLLNVHYGKLPYIKGASAAEWSLVEYGSLEISLHEIDEGVDTGKIINVVAVDIKGVTSLAEVRNKIQEYIPKIYFQYLVGDTEPTNLDNNAGKIYTFMHRDLSMILEQRLNNESTAHSGL